MARYLQTLLSAGKRTRADVRMREHHLDRLRPAADEHEALNRRLSSIMRGTPDGRMLAMLTGSCLCREVSYEVDATIEGIAHCHCETCRKTHGAAFSSIASVPRDRFSWTGGEDLLNSYESSPGKLRRFCSRCGSQIVAERLAHPHVMLRLGCLDTPVTIDRQWHIWRSDGATWYDPGDFHPELAKGFPPR